MSVYTKTIITGGSGSRSRKRLFARSKPAVSSRIVLDRAGLDISNFEAVMEVAARKTADAHHQLCRVHEGRPLRAGNRPGRQGQRQRPGHARGGR